MPSPIIHMPYTWRCADCNRYGNNGNQCPACGSSVVWPAGKLLKAGKERAA